AFHLLVAAFTKLRRDDRAGPVDQVRGWPVLISEGAPGAVLIVLRHRIMDAQALDGGLDIRALLLEGEFVRMHADHDEALVLVWLVPFGDVRQRAQAVDARISPELNQRDLAAEAFRRQWRRIQPGGNPGELRYGAGILPRLFFAEQCGWAKLRDGKNGNENEDDQPEKLAHCHNPSCRFG